MVQGLAQLQRKLTVTIPAKVEVATRAAMEKGAEELVAMMKRLAPFEDIRESIKWTWGDAPKGSFTIFKASGGQEYAALRITIYAKDWRAHWFEFGTEERFTKTGQHTGKITATPFFFPSYRAMRKRLKSRITRQMKKAIQSESVEQ